MHQKGREAQVDLSCLLRGEKGFMANLGFVGLGVMGSEMVNRLLGEGDTVTGYNRTRSKAEWLMKKGMKWAHAPRAVVAAAGVTFSMVARSAGTVSGVNGADGL